MQTYSIILTYNAVNHGQAELIYGEALENFTENLGEFTGAEYVDATHVLGNRITGKDKSDQEWIAAQAEDVWEEGRPSQ